MLLAVVVGWRSPLQGTNAGSLSCTSMGAKHTQKTTSGQDNQSLQLSDLSYKEFNQSFLFKRGRIARCHSLPGSQKGNFKLIVCTVLLSLIFLVNEDF